MGRASAFRSQGQDFKQGVSKECQAGRVRSTTDFLSQGQGFECY